MTRSGEASSMGMWPDAAALSLALVRAGTFEPMVYLRSAFRRSSGLSSGL